ncbi:O-antigen ligase family protein [Duganella dendranthematis]|uniref:O-antigen ligase family protein n=1 Tax=Duganella dendranthematis TaxID=2728021 RepID=A0ABX6MCN2_9BURK|nr:O-antigen ligase family protein [Duganella dendranthematis]QJD92081.1 O-antigen ligase family protein [Duganella dendranthematis]
MPALPKFPALPRLPGFLRQPLGTSYLVICGLLLAAVVLGMFTPLFVATMGDSPSKMFALPAAMVFALLLIYDHKLTLLGIILFRAALDPVLSLTRISLAGIPLGVGGLLNACVILIAIMLVFERPRVVPGRAFWAWTPFLLLLCVGVIPSYERGEAIRQCLALLSFFAMFISGFYFGRTQAEFRSVMKVVVWSSAVPALYTFVDVGLHYHAGFRLASTFGHPNVLAFYLTVIITVAFYLLQTMPASYRGWQRLFLIGYLFFLLIMLAMTHTRSAWIATAIGFGMYGVLFDRRYLVYIALGGALALLVPGVGDRLLELTRDNPTGNVAEMNSASWRVALWQSAFGWMSPHSFVTGNGLQTFQHFSPTFFPLAGGIHWEAHSIYVQLIFEIGLVGLLAYLWLNWRVFKGLLPLIKVDKLAAFSLIVVLVNFLICAFSDNMFDILVYDWYWWFAVGAGSSLALSKTLTLAPRAKPGKL